MWSCTAMPSGFATSTIACVISMSARDGVGSPRGVVVHQDDRGGGEFERALDHLARIDRRVVDGAGLLHLVGDELRCACRETECGTAPCRRTPWRCGNSRARSTRTTAPAAFDLAAREPARRGLHDLELGDGGLAESLDLPQSFDRRRDHLGERAEALDQVLGERLHVALRNGAKQDQLDQFVVADARRARPAGSARAAAGDGRDSAAASSASPSDCCGFWILVSRPFDRHLYRRRDAASQSPVSAGSGCR